MNEINKNRWSKLANIKETVTPGSTVFVAYEFSDYGLWDMSNGKIFSTKEAAEAYSEEYYKANGWSLDIAEMDVN